MTSISLVIIALISCVIYLAPAGVHVCVLVANEVRGSVAAGYFHLDLAMCFFVHEADGALSFVSML